MTEASGSRLRGGKRARTREALINAAAAVIGDVGFESTSLEAVASRAGVTRGAIYGNFRNKEELFLAVVQARWERLTPPVSPGGDFASQIRAAGEALVAAMPGRRAASVGAASFQLYALTHAAMRERVAHANAATYAGMAAGLRQSAGEAGLPLCPEQFVRVMHALTDGLMFLHALTPDLVDEDTVRAAFALVAMAGDKAPACAAPSDEA